MAKKSKSKVKKKKGQEPKSQFWKERLPILKFAGAFIGLTILFFVLSSGEWFDAVRTPILKVYSSISAFILNLFGYGVKATAKVLSSPHFAVSIEEGCDAIAPAILYVVSIAVFPVAWKLKWKGILYGLLAIFVLNIIRIITLYLTGIYAESFFELMHVEVWQTIFIIFTVSLWITWLKSTIKGQVNA